MQVWRPYANLDESDRAIEYQQKAYDLRERVGTRIFLYRAPSNFRFFSHLHLIHVTPSPVLAWLEGLNDGMLRSMKVLRRVLIF
jgi:hypothetical protein